ncbi:two-partner secretion domain-containing protein [Nostoc sp. 'Lobaria pulmonaria (5183) cyanobiont']|uniref:two-partner secretion domain-containing protein n=1 Tax=Nostoc sp. 'Lobaria pulmonaria (5183) cyanobiont' TaxID=1618022 RepID=UPI000CF352B8|nr:filamentous hemagglutinin N-terminal domain-containing protein [Nostoc sp. 'Lobaria pulmonaria (5183) cyanobiont']AVH71098.1 filamentous hemagglutinin family outer membrane protein [Nostoc sp. 'Lobaria pulmonaria (5183) cyanobiont']
MNQAYSPQKASIKSILCLCLIATAFSQTLAVQAQIIPDNTLPSEASRLNQNKIEGGARRGSNLFHSFSEFNIQDGEQVYFVNPTGIENIFTRVTGGNASNIFGTLGVDGAANLFLINPNGILFGENALLEIQGSFVGTTANGVQFGNQGIFSATNPQAPPLLLTIQPSALWFNQLNQNAGIQYKLTEKNPPGSDALGLKVGDGKSLLLVGGNVSINGGKLNAYGGRVELGGLAEPGTVALGVDGDNLSLKFPLNVTRASVSLTNEAGVFVAKEGGGNIAVNARNLEILGGSILSGGIRTNFGTSESVAGDITLNATGDIKIAPDGKSQIPDRPSQVRNLVRRGSKGNGGNITIDSASFSLRDGASLQASTYGQGNAGNVTVAAKNAVYLAGKGSAIYTTVEAGEPGEPGGVGNGGNININATTLSLRNGAQIQASTSGQGNAGNVTVVAKNAVDLAGNAAIFTTVDGGKGNGGNIDINATTLSLRDGAQLQALTDRQGNAGNINVKVTGAVDIAGKNIDFESGIRSQVKTGAVGNGGNIFIDSGSFLLGDGAQIRASTSGQGNAGNVRVDAKNAVDLAGKATIFTTVEAGGVGNGGNIDINATTLSLTNGAQLQTITREASDDQPAGMGNAGNVNIKVTGAVDIAGKKVDVDSPENETVFESKISSEVETGAVGNGGNILIDSGSFSLRDEALVTASTFGQGNGGNIEINSPKITLDNQGKLNAESAFSNAGNININSDLLLLRHGAQISTTAGTAEKGGNGGDIDINSKFIVAIPEENSDISANAYTGRGGKVQINSQGIFGIEKRPKPTEKSDITVSSTFGVSGIININVPDTSYIQNSFTGFSPNVIDTNALIANSCISRSSKQEGTFLITGSGALRSSPGDGLISIYSTGEVRNVNDSKLQTWKKGDLIIEPTGVYRLADGQLILSRECH